MTLVQLGCRSHDSFTPRDFPRMILSAPLWTSLSCGCEDGGPVHLPEVRRTAVVVEVTTVSQRASCQYTT